MGCGCNILASIRNNATMCQTADFFLCYLAVFKTMLQENRITNNINLEFLLYCFMAFGFKDRKR